VFLIESAPEDPTQTRILLLDGHGSHIPTDFMWECEINNVKLFYLPAHSSHVTQPLDLSIFAPIKHQYRKEIDAIATYDDTGPVKKIRFIQFYNKARQWALTPKNILAGWRGSGLIPFNPDKVLNSKQVQLSQTTPQTPLKSRKRALPDEFAYLQTPSTRKELDTTIETLRKSEILSRPVRMALVKIAKGFDTLHLIRARDELQLKGQQVIINEVRAKRGRKKVAHDPNSKFVRIRDIKEAQDQQEAQKAAWATKDRAAEARRTAQSIQSRDMTAFMSEFSAVDMSCVVNSL
jgi:DDE superfamily endonuclease